ncbi:elongation factor G [Tistrella bauzanensis]|uniref:Elongation factor G n=1 Tax=Tistrella arctica TaxID=3133430 RepID=A0ABU9YHE9_9PROT
MSTTMNGTRGGGAAMPDRAPAAPRCAALIGPYGTGKTSLLEAMLWISGTTARLGRVSDGSARGDAWPEARGQISGGLTLNTARIDYLGERWTILDCPGAADCRQDMRDVLSVADVAVVVCEPDPARVEALAPIFALLERTRMPHMVFINKVDTLSVRVAEILDALQSVSRRPLVLREVPIREHGPGGAERVVGHVDLASERAYRYRPGSASEVVRLPASLSAREQDARRVMLETLADFDDVLLEQLLDETQPPRAEIYQDLGREFGREHIVPVFFGTALEGFGVRRLMKALRHETPDVTVTACRQGVLAPGEMMADGARTGGESAAAGAEAPVRGVDDGRMRARVFKILHLPHLGRVGLARVWSGTVAEGCDFAGQRLGQTGMLDGPALIRRSDPAVAGEVVVLPRLEAVPPGVLVDATGILDEPDDRRHVQAPAPIAALTLVASRAADETKLGAALSRLVEEDPSYCVDPRPETSETVLMGQGERHLALAVERLRLRFGIEVEARPPKIAFRETLRRPAGARGRHKRQSGGHGQFADVSIEVVPLDRGEGFHFEDRTVGGSVPRNYVPAVEAGIRDALTTGPLGFPVVDVAVALLDGQHHAVDSSDMAFRTAARQAMADALAEGDPVLLEPLRPVKVTAPGTATARMHAVLQAARGQIMGLEAVAQPVGWDRIEALVPDVELPRLIIDLAAATQGLAEITAGDPRLQEAPGKLGERLARTHAA